MKLTTIQEDYVYNTIKALETQFDDVMEGLKEIHQLSEEGFNAINKKIALMVMDATITEEEKLKMTAREQKKVFSEIQEEIKEVFNEEYKLQKKIIQDKLLTEAINYKLYKDFTLNGEFGFDPMQEMDKFLKVVNKEVNGADWSKRLWKAKQNTMRDLNKAVKDLGKGYTTLSEVKKRIKKYNSNNNYAVNRLVRNELVRVQSEINEEFDKENGIEYQLFMATLDSKTTDICRNLDGKSFKIDDKNKPIPPNGTHIQCRSTLIGIPDKNWRPSTRRDNETGEIVPYKAWKKENEVKVREREVIETTEGKLPKYAVKKEEVSKPIKRKSRSEFADREDYRKHLDERKAQRIEYAEYLEDKKKQILSRPIKYTREEAEKRLLELGAKKVNLSDFDPNLLEDLVDTIVINSKKIKGVDLGYIGSDINVVEDYIKKDLFEENVKYYMRTDGMTRKQAIEYLKKNMDISNYDMDGGMIEASMGMVFNRRYAGDLERILDNELESFLTGERAFGNGTIQSTFTHEYGHRVARKLHDKGITERDIVSEVFKKFPNAFVSEYATENSMEMFAELYTEYILSPKPSSAVQYFGEILLKNLK